MAVDHRPGALALPGGVQSFVIVSTAYVVSPPKWGRAPYYEIVAGYDHSPDSARQVFATRDERLVERALAAEGRDERFALRAAGTLEGSRHAIRVLTALDPVPEAAHV